MSGNRRREPDRLLGRVGIVEGQVPRAARIIGEREADVDEGDDGREEEEGGGGWRSNEGEERHGVMWDNCAKRRDRVIQ